MGVSTFTGFHSMVGTATSKGGFGMLGLKICFTTLDRLTPAPFPIAGTAAPLPKGRESTCTLRLGASGRARPDAYA